jgi:lysophospholipase L1-like esterase
MSLPGPQLPWPVNRRPLSLVAFGNSVATLQIPVRADRSDGTYIEVLADLLGAAGIPAVPHLESRWFDFLHRAMRHYEARVRVHAPDVIVVQFGLNEYQPWLAPVWLLRHLMVQNQAVSRTARAYRSKVTPRLWKWMRTYRRAGVVCQVSVPAYGETARFEGNLRRLIRNVRREARPLVLVLDIDHPGPTLEHFLPGVGVRHPVYQELIGRVVAEAGDPEVRLVRVSAITAAIGPQAMADGMHYTTATHFAVGQALSVEVLSWLEERGRR